MITENELALEDAQRGAPELIDAACEASAAGDHARVLAFAERAIAAAAREHAEIVEQATALIAASEKGRAAVK